MAAIYFISFKNQEDISHFKIESDLSQSFAIRTVNKDTVVVEFFLQESENRDYMLEHFQLDLQKFW